MTITKTAHTDIYFFNNDDIFLSKCFIWDKIHIIGSYSNQLEP